MSSHHCSDNESSNRSDDGSCAYGIDPPASFGIPVVAEEIVKYVCFPCARQRWHRIDGPVCVCVCVCGLRLYSSAWATVAYMKKEKISGKVYYVGEAGLGQELEKEGYEAFGLEHGDLKTLPSPFTVDPDVKAVVVGLDRFVRLRADE